MPGPADGESGFWGRQFAQKATRAQKIFDIQFGVLLPAACFYLDPMVFRPFGIHRGMFQEFQVFAYTISAMAMAVLLAWILLPGRLSCFSGFIAGALLAGALFALVTGVALLPISFIGLILIIGILGFTPFLCVPIYLRNGIRALRTAREQMRPAALSLWIVLGGICTFGVPALLQGLDHHMAGDITGKTIRIFPD